MRHIENHAAQRAEIVSGFRGNFGYKAVCGHAWDGVDFEKIGVQIVIGEEIDADDTAGTIERADDGFGVAAQFRVKFGTKCGWGQINGIVAVIFGLIVVEPGFGDNLADAECFAVEGGDGQLMAANVLFEDHDFVVRQAGCVNGIIHLINGIDNGYADARTIAGRFDRQWQ